MRLASILFLCTILAVMSVALIPSIAAIQCGNQWCEQGEQSSCQQDCPGANNTQWTPSVEKEYSFGTNEELVDADSYNNTYAVLTKRGNTGIIRLFGTNGTLQQKTKVSSSCTGFGCGSFTIQDTVLFDDGRVIVPVSVSLQNSQKLFVYDMNLQEVAKGKLQIRRNAVPLNYDANSNSFQLVAPARQNNNLIAQLIAVQIQGNALSISSRSQIGTLPSLSSRSNKYATDKQQRGALFAGDSYGFGGGTSQLVSFNFSGSVVFSLSGSPQGNSGTTEDISVSSQGVVYTCGNDGNQNYFLQKRTSPQGRKAWQTQIFSQVSRVISRSMVCLRDTANRTLVFALPYDQSQREWTYRVKGYRPNNRFIGGATLSDVTQRSAQILSTANTDIAVFFMKNKAGFGSQSFTFHKYTQIRTPLQQAPQANFTYTPAIPYANNTVTFDATASSDPDGSIQSYMWQFGDGAVGSGAQTTHAYTASGNYTVTLTVTDDDGLQDSMQQMVHVNETPGPDDAPPVVNFNYTPSSPEAGQTITFDASPSRDPDGGSFVSYQWLFGDGSKATSSTATNSYSGEGRYYVWLLATDDERDSGESMQPICVGDTDCGGASQQLLDLIPGWNMAYMDTDAPVPVQAVENSCGGIVAMQLVNGSLQHVRTA